MTSSISKQNILLPEFGKKQISLKNFSWKIDLSKIFIIYLPCASKKPYYLSSTHSYFKQKLKEFLPLNWDKLVQICTISEVIGIIPEDLEDLIFDKKNGNFDKYNYEHYPTYKENDIENTRRWLMKFIQDHKKNSHFAYLTSKTFKEICENIIQLKVYPIQFNPRSALFEFRKRVNILEFCKTVEKEYISILKKRFLRWEKNRSQPFLVLKKFKDSEVFTPKDVKKYLPEIKSPYSLLSKLCHEGKNQYGIFLEKRERGKYKSEPNLRKFF